MDKKLVHYMAKNCFFLLWKMLCKNERQLSFSSVIQSRVECSVCLYLDVLQCFILGCLTERHLQWLWSSVGVKIRHLKDRTSITDIIDSTPQVSLLLTTLSCYILVSLTCVPMSLFPLILVLSSIYALHVRNRLLEQKEQKWCLSRREEMKEASCWRSIVWISVCVSIWWLFRRRGNGMIMTVIAIIM